MSTKCSCGHEVEYTTDENCITITLKGYTREFERCLVIASYCKECVKEAEELGDLLHNEKEEQQWLSGEMDE